MYMPGRSRTGSSPSRTVMSFAVYVASLIEKALQTGRLRALGSLPEAAVGIRVYEAPRSGFGDDFAKTLVIDLRCESGGVLTRFGAGRNRSSPNALRLQKRGIGQRPDREAESRRRELAELLPNARFELTELEGPRGRARVHVQRAVAGDACRPRVSRDLRPDRSRPCLDERRHTGRGPEPRQLALDRVADAVDHAVVTSPGVTSSSCEGSTGSAAAVVEVMSVWPRAATRSASVRRRAGSSSDSTSSSSRSGG